MQYLGHFTPDGDGFIVTFPAFPEANTAGHDEAEALDNARDALEVTVLTYTKDNRNLPPSDQDSVTEGLYHRISISAAVLAKLSFIQAFRASGMTRSGLAARLGKGENEVRRMLDPYHATKLRTIENGLLVLGKRLVITVEAA
ncbi:type II toxin-antitoxin system HicB family antitoxin [uncultured Devosia sp.]|uniref:type II toxin-antitoxin system HicB family antitoxin n=1 Tax=uncultured Devosia sp. TaxID=211434 RepID=UPI0035CB4D29